MPLPRKEMPKGLPNEAQNSLVSLRRLWVRKEQFVNIVRRAPPGGETPIHHSDAELDDDNFGARDKQNLMFGVSLTSGFH
jgi:hypothetical protein